MNLLKPLSTPSLLTPHKLFFIQSFHKERKLVSKQNPGQDNPLIQLAIDLSHKTPLEKPVRQHSPHSSHILPPASPASQQLQQECAISIFPSPQLISLPTQHLPKQPHKLYLTVPYPIIKDPAPLNTPTPHDTTTKLWITPPHPTLLLSLIHFPAMKTLCTYSDYTT